MTTRTQVFIRWCTNEESLMMRPRALYVWCNWYIHYFNWNVCGWNRFEYIPYVRFSLNSTQQLTVLHTFGFLIVIFILFVMTTYILKKGQLMCSLDDVITWAFYKAYQTSHNSEIRGAVTHSESQDYVYGKREYNGTMVQLSTIRDVKITFSLSRSQNGRCECSDFNVIQKTLA